MNTDAYNDESDDGTEDEEEEAPQSAGPAPRALGDDDGRDRDIVTPKVEEADEDSGPLSEWFRVKTEDVEGSVPLMFPEDSETENDSDNADVAEPEEPDLDDWFKVKDERDEDSVASTSKLSEDYDKVMIECAILLDWLWTDWVLLFVVRSTQTRMGMSRWGRRTMRCPMTQMLSLDICTYFFFLCNPGRRPFGFRLQMLLSGLARQC
jgi:hypothetical protein